MRYEIIDRQAGQQIDQADTYNELKEKLQDDCYIRDTARGMECSIGMMFPEFEMENNYK